jgi:hypothetical protein
MNTSYTIRTKTFISDKHQKIYGSILLIIWLITLISFTLLKPKILNGITLSILLLLCFNIFNIRIHEYSHHYFGRLVKINSEVKLEEKICIPHGVNSRNRLIFMTLGPIVVETCLFLILMFINIFPSFPYLINCLFGWQGDIYLIYMFTKASKDTYFSFDYSNKVFKTENLK